MKKTLFFIALFISGMAFSQVTILTTNTTWSGDVTLDGKVVVESGATLTIQPGTVVKAVFKANPVDASALIIAKGGKIIANGTAALPIIFTAAADPITSANVAAGTYVSIGNLEVGGLWGGVVVLGNNKIGAGVNNTANIEGIASGQTWTTYGGSMTNENSGSLKYVSIRHGGATLSNGDELNGLTLGGVGSGTVIENIEIISNTDDGIEIFGGNVNVNNLLVYNATDDAIDLDQAYSGTITNSFVIMGEIGDNVFEIDGTESTSNPVVTGSYTINGVTAIGSLTAAQSDTYGHWKASAMGANNNIVFKGFKSGNKVEGIDATTFGNGTLTFSNLDFVTTNTLASISTQLTSTHAEILSVQASGTGANTCSFSGWTAYSTKDANLCSSTNVGNGTVAFINSNTTWSGDVNMNGKVVVNSGATLTIEPGTVIKATFKADPVDASALIIAKGGKIIANGTAVLPIIFTSEYDALTAANVAAGTYVAQGQNLDLGGLWGGVVVLGNNVIGAGANNTANIEGIASGQTWTTYGGSMTNENSGSLKYLSIRHGGATLSNGDELNGLTFGGVGSGTVVENIEIISNTDDGIEIFGGNVNVNNLLVYNSTDDAIDLDQAYSGTITNSFVIMGEIGDNVFEIDGTESTSNPVVTGSYTINGVTAIGNLNAAQSDTYGHWKASAKGANNNIVFKGFKSGNKVEGIDATTFGNGTLTFSNLDFVTTNTLASISTQLTSTHAEILSAQASGTGANTCSFSGWTAYSTKDANLCSSTNVGNGTVAFINSNTTWSGDVNMNGKVVVNSGATLTIVPGTVIKATFKADPVDASALIIAKGGKIIADGTAALPIIFTSEYDALTAANVASGTYVAPNQNLDLGGLWGGVVVLGNNVIGAGANNTANIEGIASGQTWTNYGGSLTNENSGILDYISIRHGGATLSNGDELNGLTLGGVGSGTVISNIEIISNTDDGIEIFGGNVNVDKILIYNATDDAIDLDQAYSGTITNAYVAMGEIGDNVFEIDGTESTSNPVVTGSYTINGVTAIGNLNAAQSDTYGHWKALAMGANNNIVFKGFKSGNKVEGIDATTFGNGTLTFSNLDFVTTNTLASISTVLTSTQAEILSLPAPGTGSTEDHFYTWTAYFKGGKGTLGIEKKILNSNFSVYPNPFSDNLNVSEQLKVEALKLFSITGQLLKQNKNSNSLNVSELTAGTYLLEVNADSSREVKIVIKK